MKLSEIFTLINGRVVGDATITDEADEGMVRLLRPSKSIAGMLIGYCDPAEIPFCPIAFL